MREVRVATLRTYVEVANSLGLDGRGMLIRVGIHPDALKDTENRVPAEAVARLLEISAQESGCENFGLLLGENRSLATLGPMSMLLERCARYFAPASPTSGTSTTSALFPSRRPKKDAASG